MRNLIFSGFFVTPSWQKKFAVGSFEKKKSGAAMKVPFNCGPIQEIRRFSGRRFSCPRPENQRPRNYKKKNHENRKIFSPRNPGLLKLQRYSHAALTVILPDFQKKIRRWAKDRSVGNFWSAFTFREILQEIRDFGSRKKSRHAGVTFAPCIFRLRAQCAI